MTIIRLILKDGERPLKNRTWFDTRAQDCELELEGQFVRVAWEDTQFLIPLTSISHLEVEAITATPVITPVKKRRRKAKTPPPPLAPSSAPQVAEHPSLKHASAYSIAIDSKGQPVKVVV